MVQAKLPSSGAPRLQVPAALSKDGKKMDGDADRSIRPAKRWPPAAGCRVIAVHPSGASTCACRRQQPYLFASARAAPARCLYNQPAPILRRRVLPSRRSAPLLCLHALYLRRSRSREENGHGGFQGVVRAGSKISRAPERTRLYEPFRLNIFYFVIRYRR